MKERNWSRSIQKLWITGMIAALITGCATPPRRSYSGKPLPDEQIARIAVEVKKQSIWDGAFGPPAPRIYITHVDQQPLGSFWSLHGPLCEVVDLLPGEHSISVASISGGGALEVAAQQRETHQASGYGKVLKLNAQPGHKYIVKYIEKRLPLICWVEDEATGVIVSGDKPANAGNLQ